MWRFWRSLYCTCRLLLKRYHFFAILILLFHELKFFIFRYPLISFLSILRSLPSNLSLAHIYWFLNYLWLLWKASNAWRVTKLYELILHPATLLKVFISCSNFLVEHLESFIYTIISTNKGTLISLFLICIPLISLSYCSR